MDIFGHAALSVGLGRAVAPKPELRAATTAAALFGGLAPDVDAVTYLWSPEAFRAIHQLYTHNILALALLPPLGALALRRRYPAAGRWLFIAAWLGMLGHLVGDTLALWPVPLLQPSRPWWC